MHNFIDCLSENKNGGDGVFVSPNQLSSLIRFSKKIVVNECGGKHSFVFLRLSYNVVAGLAGISEFHPVLLDRAVSQ